MKRLFTACFAFAIALSLRADTVVFKNGEELEGTILEKDESTLKLEVEFGTVIVPMVTVRRIDLDTPEKIAERERKKAEAAELAKKMADEGKVLYKGKWVTEEEKKADEDKIADAKKKKKEAADAAKKKADDEAAKAKEEQQKKAAELAQNNNSNNRADRFSQRHNRNDLTGQGLNNNNASTYNNGSINQGNTYGGNGTMNSNGNYRGY